MTPVMLRLEPVPVIQAPLPYFGVNYPLNESGGSGVRVSGLLVTPPNETKTVAPDWPGRRHPAGQQYALHR